MNIKKLTGLASVAAIAALISIGGGVALAAHPGTVVFVDVAGPSCPGTGTAADPFCTIQDAIDHASDGDVIEIAAGTYVENVTIAKSITLRGEDPGIVADPSDLLTAGVLNSVLEAAIPADAVILVTDTFDGLAIENLRVIGHTGNGTMNLQFATSASDLSLDRVAFDGGARLLYTTGFPDVATVSLTNSAFRCSTASASGLELWFVQSDLTVVNNFITECRDGVNLGSSGGIAPPVGGTSVIRGNTVEETGDSGIQIAISYVDLLVAENRVIKAGLFEAGTGEGIQVERTDQPTSVRVEDNLIQDGDDGLVFSFFPFAISGASVTATGNLITVNANVGVRVKSGVTPGDVPGLHVNDNCIEGNVEGARNDVAATTLDAKANWWGNPSGPSGLGPGSGDSVSAGVDFALFLTTPPPCGPPLPVIAVDIDIKPGSCPNPFNTKSRGKLPVAILGTPDLDVTTIDPASIRLEGVAPIKSAIEHVGTPFGGPVEGCSDCTTDGPDGFPDLTLKFDRQELVAAIRPVLDAECLILTLTGNLKDEFSGTPIEGADVVVILKKGKQGNQSSKGKKGKQGNQSSKGKKGKK